MKRVTVIFLVATLTVSLGWAGYQAVAPVDPPLSRSMPAGALLYLEAKDFSNLLHDWNASPQKREWVQSANYEVFSRSRLLLRLKDAGEQFAKAAGLPPDKEFLSQVAGTRSALGLYDIGNLQFLYITRLSSARSMQSALWETREKFEPRKVAGQSFYLRRDPESQKVVAFAVSGDYLLLATREDLIAGALQLMSGTKDRTLESEAWFAQSVAATGEPGDLRMALDLEKLVPSPYFRTYWVQQNISDLKQYSAAVSDLFRSGKEYREERVLLRKSEAADASPPPGRSLPEIVLVPAGGLEATAAVVRLVPDGAGFFEAHAYPSAAAAFSLLETKLLAPHLGPAPPSQIAPGSQLTSGDTGSGSDLETRIDQSPVQGTVHQAQTPALKDLLERTALLASLQIQSTETDKAGVFVRMHSVIVLSAAADWDTAAVQAAIADFVRPGLTASQLGVAWQAKSGYQQFDGLWPFAVAVRGRDLVVSDDPALMESVLSNFDRKPDRAPATLIAGFNHGREGKTFARFTRLVDGANRFDGRFSSGSRQPQFFSDNIGSLSSTLAGVFSEGITIREDGNKVLQTVVYEWSQ